MTKALPLLASITLVVAACGSPTGTASPPAASGTGAVASTASAAAPSVSPASEGPVAPSASAAAGASDGPTGIDPSDFVATVSNPWFPLTPGTKLTYTGDKDGEKAVDVFEVTNETKVIDGVTCLVIRDSLTLGGVLEERTEDWYVQDRAGNVWYFGEDTAELDEAGKVVSTEGSWMAGQDGAEPGIFMPADPRVGVSGQQEFYAGQAEDHFVVLLTTAKAKVPAGNYANALLTAEWTPLEPDVLGEKLYVKGVGLVKEFDVAGGKETLALARIEGP
jgi:hypothetical protein